MRKDALSQAKRIAATYKQLCLTEERKLITHAKKGDQSAREKLALHLTGFFLFRIETTLFSAVKKRHGEDILQECYLLLDIKVRSFKLRYKDRKGVMKRVRLSTYLWKSVTGLMFLHAYKARKESPVAGLHTYCRGCY